MLAAPPARGLVRVLRGRRHYWVRPNGPQPSTPHAQHHPDSALHELAAHAAGARGRANPKLRLYHAEKIRADLDDTFGRHVKLQQIKEAFTPTGFQSRVLSLKQESGGLNLGMVLSHGGKEVGVINRSFKRERNGDLTVHHELFDLDPSQQGKGAAKDVMRKSFALYEKIGVKAIHVDAMDVGRYTWASMGFRARTSDDAAKARQKFGEYLDTVGLGKEKKSLLAKAKDFPDIAALTHKANPVGRDFLLRTDQPRIDVWLGELRVDRKDPYWQHARHKVGLED